MGETYIHTQNVALFKMVTIDNHFIQTVDCLGGATVPVPGNEIYYSPKLIRFSGLNNTQHTVKVVINASTSDYTSIDWIAGFNSSNVTAAATKIYLINVPPYTDTDYAAISTDVNTTIAYNRMIRDTVNSLNRDGLNISLVDIFTGYNASTMSVPDGLHPNDAGNIFVAEKLETALHTPVTPETPGQNWIVSTINAFLNMLKNMGLHLGCVAWQT